MNISPIALKIWAVHNTTSRITTRKSFHDTWKTEDEFLAMMSDIPNIDDVVHDLSVAVDNMDWIDGAVCCFDADFPVINTRNMQLIEHHELAQELLDSLTLPQNFMSAIRFASMLGVDDFTIVSNKTLDLEKIILKTLPQAKINQIAFIEISLADMEFIG